MKVHLLETGKVSLQNNMKELEHIQVNIQNNTKVYSIQTLLRTILEIEHIQVNIQTTILKHLQLSIQKYIKDNLKEQEHTQVNTLETSKVHLQLHM